MRILHCPANVGGNSWTLSRAERKLGLDSDVMVFRKDWLEYPVDINLHLSKNSKASSAFRLLTFFLGALAHYDVFHFNFGSSFLPQVRDLGIFELSDLPVLRGLGKKIVVTYQGCDVRQKDFCVRNYAISACAELDCYGSRCTSKADALKKRRAEKFGRYSHKMFAISPDILRFLPKHADLLPCPRVDLSQWQPVKKKVDKRLVIVHSPTNRACKGTKYILDAVERLKVKSAHEIELILAENIPHSKVHELYRQADVAVDQLLVGWYGGFAVEMMALGKPVVCYIREEDLKFIPPQMKKDLPIINANPETVYEVLEHLVVERDGLLSIGERGRAYVERWHDPVKIARKMKQTYESLFE
ncbi:MAG: glycosyltransferase [Chloroflexi bacterium]|nr:glycosyltransferase [Chloroflexota bacterium]